MANIFGILTTVTLLLSLFVASKNKSRYEIEIVRVTEEKAKLAVTQERLATAQKKLSDIIEEIPKAQARAAELEAETDEQRANNTQLESQIQAKTNDLNRIRESNSKLQEEINASGNLDQLAQNLRSLQTEIAAINDEDDGLPARIASVDRMASQALQIEAETTTTAMMLDGYARGESRPGMTTRIRSIYPNWGFVTLASGGASGIAGNSTMDVIRGNEIIAKLQVTAVEPNSATATIVPGTLSDDIVLSVGDTVVPGTRLENN